ncbi:hypothetical protein IJT10_06165, partial [bacterium]|nr:hypothetical protein [bacterium]
LWKHLVVFCLICLPLGFWFSLRSYIKFDIPLLYVQKMPPSDDSFNGDKSYWDNISDLSLSPLKYPFLQIRNRTESGCNDRNPIIIALKTSLFGESINEKTFTDHKRGVEFVAKLLFIVNIFINLMAVMTMLLLLIRNKHNKIYLEKILFLISFYLIMWLGIYKQYYDQIFISSANFRYIAPSATIAALFIGLLLKNTKGKLVTNLVKFATLIFVVTTSIIYCSLV